jgi:hypothetical protein
VDNSGFVKTLTITRFQYVIVRWLPPKKIASPSQKTISPTANIFFKSLAMQQGNSMQKMCRVFGEIEFVGLEGLHILSRSAKF